MSITLTKQQTLNQSLLLRYYGYRSTTALRILVRVEFVEPKGRPGLGAFLTSGTVGFVQLNFPIKRRLF
jgi:hypothetical protein